MSMRSEILSLVHDQPDDHQREDRGVEHLDKTRFRKAGKNQQDRRKYGSACRNTVLKLLPLGLHDYGGRQDKDQQRDRSDCDRCGIVPDIRRTLSQIGLFIEHGHIDRADKVQDQIKACDLVGFKARYRSSDCRKCNNISQHNEHSGNQPGRDLYPAVKELHRRVGEQMPERLRMGLKEADRISGRKAQGDLFVRAVVDTYQCCEKPAGEQDHQADRDHDPSCSADLSLICIFHKRPPESAVHKLAYVIIIRFFLSSDRLNRTLFLPIPFLCLTLYLPVRNAVV